MHSQYVSKGVNQKTIADELGVSVMTVSRALRNHPDLSQATKDRIISKAIDLGYTKIQTPKSKSSVKRAGLFLCQEPSLFSLLDSGVMKSIFMSIEAESQKHQIELVIQFLKPGESPVAVKNETIDAAFLLGRYTAETADLFSSIPTIAVSSFTAGMHLPLITADNHGGARLTTQHLIDLGHKDILFVGENENRLSELFRVRSEGYTLAMIQNELKPVKLFCKPGDFEQIMPQVKKSTAIVCSSDAFAVELKRRIIAEGLSIPGDISLAGFDNLEGARKEEITTYAPNWELLGRTAVDLLVFQPGDLLKNNFKLIIPGELLVRSSTGPVQ